MRVIEVADDVWVAAAGYADAGQADPDDSVAATGMAGWRAREFLAGRAVLRQLLAETVPAAAHAEVIRGRHGKPALAGWPSIGINIGHDGGVAVACTSVGRACGVDVQRPAGDVSDEMVRRCGGGHADRLLGMPPRTRARELAWIWTVQEACVKAEGSGLAGRPWRIDVPPGSRAGRWRSYRWCSPRAWSATPISCAWREVS